MRRGQEKFHCSSFIYSLNTRVASVLSMFNSGMFMVYVCEIYSWRLTPNQHRERDITISQFWRDG